MEQSQAVGIAWYVREDYERILALMADSDLMPGRFDDWLERAEEVESELGRQGFFVVRVPLKPEVFAAWCRARSMAPDSEARSLFAAEAAYQEDGGPRRRPRDDAFIKFGD